MDSRAGSSTQVGEWQVMPNKFRNQLEFIYVRTDLQKILGQIIF